MNYRPEIDGLRAIAVLSVILFHAGLRAVPGGYLGVDIFFVISGYLITSIIVTEMEAGEFSFAAFYERRARRILPAMMVVVLTCVPFVLFFMLPREIFEFSKSVLAVCAFVSNIFFWAQSGYFDAGAELKPLLHTWSLGVEEQFYFGFPILLTILLRLGRKGAAVVFGCIAIASIGYAQWGPQTKEATFFLIPSRIWELLAGAVMALSPIESLRARLPNRALELLGLFGVVLLGYGIFHYSEHRYPGFRSLPPVLGASLVILFATQQTKVGRLLGSPIPVSIGLISYSAYLWHQPVFVFARLNGLGSGGVAVALALTAASVCLAGVTYIFIERPARDRKTLTRRGIVTLSLIGTLCLFSFGLGGILTGGFEKQTLYFSDSDTRRLYQLIKRDTGGDITRDMGTDDDCVFWKETIDPTARQRIINCSERFGPATVVLGDSHAMNIYNALFRAKYGRFVVGLANPGCRPWDRSRECPYVSFDELLATNHALVATVILNFSGSHLVLDEEGREEPGDVLKFGGKYHFGNDAIASTIDYLQRMSRLTKVIWLGPFTEARIDFGDFEWIKRVAKSGFHLNPASVEIFLALEKHLDAQIGRQHRDFRYVSFFEVIRPESMTLMNGSCLTYRDLDHFSVCQERVIGERLKEVLSTKATDGK